MLFVTVDEAITEDAAMAGCTFSVVRIGSFATYTPRGKPPFLTNYRFAYISTLKTDSCVIYFVEIGERYRHMERREQIKVYMYCRRIFCFDNQIFIACKHPSQPTGSTILILDINGHVRSRIQCPDFNINSLTYHVDINTQQSYLYVTDIVQGIRSYVKNGNRYEARYPSFRDFDVQWYYGITCDIYGKVFVCTQDDDFGPELYELELAENDHIVDMKFHLCISDDLEKPTTIRYNPNLDAFVVGSYGEIRGQLFKASLA